jgi:glycosyltransferase involved in cell wall biosynthesis
MKITHVLECINEGMAGLGMYVSQLTSSLARRGDLRVEVLAFDLPRWGKPLPMHPNLTLRIFEPRRPYLFGYSRAFARALEQAAGEDDCIFHLHGMWRWPMLAAARLAKEYNRPYLMSPHGCLEAGALAQKRRRKRLARWFTQGHRWLDQADALHVTSLTEARSVRTLFPDPPIAMIPIGVETPEYEHHWDNTPKRTAMYLSRLVPTKGVMDLLEAWGELQPAGWQLKVVGPDEVGYLAECRRAVERLGIADSVEFTGPLYGQEKWDLYSRSELFVLPTKGENFGIVVAEALSCGTPVITTTAAPWGELQEQGCGWWVHPSRRALTDALREATALPSDRLREMGEKGRQLARQKLSWSQVAEEMVHLYGWLLGDRPRPDFIRDP